MFDIIIIGAGVIGCAIARELSKYNLKICVLEKDSDVANGTSKANSGIVHAGYDAKPGSLKAKLNVKGNAIFNKLSKELDFPFKNIGSFVLAFDNEGIGLLKKIKKQGELNNVSGLEIISGDEAKKLEPCISKDVVAALYAPTAGITSPYEMTIALAENAYCNGVEFNLETKVDGIEKKEDYYIIDTNKGKFKSNFIINAAGVYADEINNMISKYKINIIPRRGEYCLCDKTVGDMVSKIIFQLPNEKGKGVLVTPTVDGNLLIGPNAIDIKDKDNVNTSHEGIDEVLYKAKLSLNDVPTSEIINSFSGNRAHSSKGDFIIGEAKDVENFINVAGIESPGLSAAPAIAEIVENIIIDKINVEKKEDFNPIRHGIPRFSEMSNEERENIIKENPKYGKIVCRCESVTEGEILESIKRPLGAKNIDAVKRRTRAGMGRCQSGFCLSKIVEILSNELNLPPEEITKFGGDSNILVGENKEDI